MNRYSTENYVFMLLRGLKGATFCMCGGFEKSRFKKRNSVCIMWWFGPLLSDACTPILLISLQVWPLLPSTMLQGFLSLFSSYDLSTWVMLIGGVVAVLGGIIVLFHSYKMYAQSLLHYCWLTDMYTCMCALPCHVYMCRYRCVLYLALKTWWCCHVSGSAVVHDTRDSACRVSHSFFGSPPVCSN